MWVGMTPVLCSHTPWSVRSPCALGAANSGIHGEAPSEAQCCSHKEAISEPTALEVVDCGGTHRAVHIPRASRGLLL